MKDHGCLYFFETLVSESSDWFFTFFSFFFFFPSRIWKNGFLFLFLFEYDFIGLFNGHYNEFETLIINSKNMIIRRQKTKVVFFLINRQNKSLALPLLRPVLSRLFIKKEEEDLLVIYSKKHIAPVHLQTQGIIHSESRHKKLRKKEMHFSGRMQNLDWSVCCNFRLRKSMWDPFCDSQP